MLIWSRILINEKHKNNATPIAILPINNTSGIAVIWVANTLIFGSANVIIIPIARATVIIIDNFLVFKTSDATFFPISIIEISAP